MVRCLWPSGLQFHLKVSLVETPSRGTLDIDGAAGMGGMWRVAPRSVAFALQYVAQLY